MSISLPLFPKKADAPTPPGTPPSPRRGYRPARRSGCLAIVEAVRENKEPRRSSMHRRELPGLDAVALGHVRQDHYARTDRSVQGGCGKWCDPRSFEGERCPRQTGCCDDRKPPAHCGTTAFALSFEKSGGTSNLPVCRSYLQLQPLTTPVCMGLRVLMSASPERPRRRYRFSGQSTPSQR